MNKCNKCNREYSKKNISRHKRTCKGVIINGKRPCKKCGKFFRTDHLTKHITICKGQMDEVHKLQEKLIKALEEIKEKDKEIKKSTEKDHKYQLEIAKKTTIINNYHNKIIINILGDCDFIENKKEFIKLLQNTISGNIPKLYENLMLNGDKPKYLVTDLARKKGVYKKDGNLKVDLDLRDLMRCYRTGIFEELKNNERCTYNDNIGEMAAICWCKICTLDRAISKNNIKSTTKKLNCKAYNKYKELIK